MAWVLVCEECRWEYHIFEKSFVTTPGIEPGSTQPQCVILTTVRCSPIGAGVITIYKLKLKSVIENSLIQKKAQIKH